MDSAPGPLVIDARNPARLIARVGMVEQARAVRETAGARQ